MGVIVVAHYNNTSCFKRSLSINVFYSQGNDEDSDQSKEQEGERSKSADEEVEDRGAEGQEGETVGTTADTLTAQVSNLSL